MTQPHDADKWRKSSASTNTADCVELNGRLDAVRDSKNGATLRVDARAMAALLATAREHADHA
jgi:hypothetical protein